MARKEPKRNVYVGHRYVPKVMGEWDKKETYEGLSIVTHKGTSYTSKKRVPKGIDILNEKYWVVTGNYDAQIEDYRKDVRELQKNVTDDMNELESDINKNISDFKGSVNNDIKTFKTETNTKITETNTKITETNTKIDNFEQETNEEISNSNKIINDLKDNADFGEVTYYKEYLEEYDNTVYLVHVPYKDKNNNKLIMNSAGLYNKDQTIQDFAKENKTTLAINAGMFGDTRNIPDHTTIINNEIILNKPTNKDYREILAIMEDGTLKIYDGNTDASILINDGVKDATVGFASLIKDGQKQSENFTNHGGFTEHHPRQIIAQTSNKDYYILSIGGRKVDGKGATIQQCYDIITSIVPDIQVAYNLDGGGSTQTVVHDSLITQPYDKRRGVIGTTTRVRPNVFYIKKENKEIINDNLSIQGLSENMGNMQDDINFLKGIQHGHFTPYLGYDDTDKAEFIEYENQQGTYTRMGNIVFFQYAITATINDNESGDTLRITGLEGSTIGIPTYGSIPKNDNLPIKMNEPYTYLSGNSGASLMLFYYDYDEEENLKISKGIRGIDLIDRKITLAGTHIYRTRGWLSKAK